MNGVCQWCQSKTPKVWLREAAEVPRRAPGVDKVPSRPFLDRGCCAIGDRVVLALFESSIALSSSFGAQRSLSLDLTNLEAVAAADVQTTPGVLRPLRPLMGFLGELEFVEQQRCFLSEEGWKRLLLSWELPSILRTGRCGLVRSDARAGICAFVREDAARWLARTLVVLITTG